MLDKEILTGEVIYSEPIFEFNPSPFQVYAKSKNGLVYKFYSTCFQEVEEGDTFIKEGFGDEFVHVGYYQVYNENMCHNYKIVSNKLIETTEEEKQQELLKIKCNQQTDINSDHMKIALMAKNITDLMLNEYAVMEGGGDN